MCLPCINYNKDDDDDDDDEFDISTLWGLSSINILSCFIPEIPEIKNK